MSSTNGNPGPRGAQATGNPVLDSVVNIVAASAANHSVSIDFVEKLHAVLLKLAEQEPGGLKSEVKNHAVRRPRRTVQP